MPCGLLVEDHAPSVRHTYPQARNHRGPPRHGPRSQVYVSLRPLALDKRRASRGLAGPFKDTDR